MWASNQTYVQKTIDCVTFLMKNAGGKIDILEVMNEPAGFLGDDFTNVLRQYYIDSYNAIRTAIGNGTGVMFSDGFRGLDVSTSLRHMFLNLWLNLHRSIGETPLILLNTKERQWIPCEAYHLLFSYPTLTIAAKSTCTKSSATTSSPVLLINISPTHAA
jgi:hypothetical protein